MSNMGVEIGAKFAIFPCDDKTLEYLEGKMIRPPMPAVSDPDARYEAVYTLDVTDLSPYVALPMILGTLFQSSRSRRRGSRLTRPSSAPAPTPAWRTSTWLLEFSRAAKCTRTCG